MKKRSLRKIHFCNNLIIFFIDGQLFKKKLYFFLYRYFLLVFLFSKLWVMFGSQKVLKQEKKY